MKGAEFLAYPPVVAAGERATIIHYINNNQLVRPEEMVLLDAGKSFFTLKAGSFVNHLYCTRLRIPWLQQRHNKNVAN